MQRQFLSMAFVFIIMLTGCNLDSSDGGSDFGPADSTTMPDAIREMSNATITSDLRQTTEMPDPYQGNIFVKVFDKNSLSHNHFIQQFLFIKRMVHLIIMIGRKVQNDAGFHRMFPMDRYPDAANKFTVDFNPIRAADGVISLVKIKHDPRRRVGFKHK